MCACTVNWGEGNSQAVSTLLELDALLDDLTRRFAGEAAILAEIVGPAGDALVIGVGRSRSVLSYVRASGAPPYLASLDSSPAAETAEAVLVFSFGGQYTEILGRHAISPDLAREGARHFFRTGGLLETIQWVET